MPPKRIRCTASQCREPAQRIVGDCTFCQGHFCGKHRLLEDHKCTGLEDVSNTRPHSLSTAVANLPIVQETVPRAKRCAARVRAHPGYPGRMTRSRTLRSRSLASLHGFTGNFDDHDVMTRYGAGIYRS
ncbi:hypothetical protein AUP68_01718 [Ilyonectria robusta]